MKTTAKDLILRTKAKKLLQYLNDQIDGYIIINDCQNKEYKALVKRHKQIVKFLGIIK